MCQGGSRGTNSGQHSECGHRVKKLPVEKGRTGKEALWAESWMVVRADGGALAWPKVCIDL